MSLTAWARQKQPIDLTADLVLALALFALAIPLLISLDSRNTYTAISEEDTKPAPPVKALRQAIIGQESGGQCRIQNHSGSGAAGLAQVMPENVSAWSREALGRSVSVEEFLTDCALQRRVIDFKLTQYWQQEAQDGRDEGAIVRRIASRWYAGRADLFDAAAPQYWNSQPYPSIRDYTLAVLERYQYRRST